MIFLKYWVYLMGFTMFYMVFAESHDRISKEHVKRSFIRLLKNIIKVNEKRMAILKKLTELDDNNFIQTRTTDIDDDYDEPKEKDHDTAAKNVILALLKIIHAKGKFGRTRKSSNQNKPAIKIQFSPVNIDHTIEVKPNLKKEPQQLDINKNIARIRDDEEEIQLKEVSTSESTEFLTIESTKEHSDLKIDLTGDENKVAVSAGDKKVSVLVEDIRRSWMDSCSKKASKVCIDACINAHRNFCRMYSCSSRAKKRFKRECKISCKTKFVLNSRYSDVE